MCLAVMLKNTANTYAVMLSARRKTHLKKRLVHPVSNRWQINQHFIYDTRPNIEEIGKEVFNYLCMSITS